MAQTESINDVRPPAQDVTTLYCLMGEALCMIQHLEEALCHSYTLQLNSKSPKEQADIVLEKNRSNTLGDAIKFTKKNALYTDSFQMELEVLRVERNWLVHKIVPYSLDEMYAESSKGKLFDRIRAISKKAYILQQTIEDGMIEFCESAGKDMSKVRAEISRLRLL